jgi:hypothetical protein
VALGQVFSECFGFPCQSLFHQLLHNHPHLSSGAGTIGQKWPQYKGLSPTPVAIKKADEEQNLEYNETMGQMMYINFKSYVKLLKRVPLGKCRQKALWKMYAVLSVTYISLCKRRKCISSKRHRLPYRNINEKSRLILQNVGGWAILKWNLNR